MQDLNNVQGVSDESLKEVVGLAAKVSYSDKKNKVCAICIKLNKDSDHTLSKCHNFKTNESKIKQLEVLEGCVKCGYTSHTTDKCRFRLNSKCFSCQGWHMSFLCPVSKSNSQVNSKPEKQDKTSEKLKSIKGKSKNETKNTTNNLVIFSESWKSESNDSLILPTFVGLINGSKVRGFKDGGCQSNFISQNFAKSLNLKIIKEKVSLSIKGINVQKNYDTKLVELNLQLGSNIFNIEAYRLPSINIDLDLPGLAGVASKFVNKNFKLADDLLTHSGDKIDNIEFILGVQSAYCLPETEIVFGNSKSSVYSESPIGTILKGNIDKLKQDLNFLDSKNDENLNSKIISSAFAAGANFQALKSDAEICKIDKFDDFSVDADETLVESDLLRATEGVLKYYSKFYVGEDFNNYQDLKSDLNEKLVEKTLDWTVRDAEGRLVMPLMWNDKVSHLLGKNFKLAKSILRSVTNKLETDSEKMKMINEVFKTQEESKIIQRIDNLDEFMVKNPDYSFLPFMGIFKMDKETSKCRVVFLSNLCEKIPENNLTVSHNQCLFAGPSLNQKLTTALLQLRFAKFLLCWDLKKAFNQIGLNEFDSNKLLFLWYKDYDNGDYSLIAYRNIRLTFGLRCSPAILMLALFKILVLDKSETDFELNELKKLIYNLTYMDNCALSADDEDYLNWSYSKLSNIFESYGFGLQQFITNNFKLQEKIDKEYLVDTAVNSKLFGMIWHRDSDIISTKPINLNINADTKRLILGTVAEQFDIYNFNSPLLNRSKLFLHELQNDNQMGWDEKLSEDRLREWSNIVKQANSAPPIEIKRCVGSRNDTYDLVCFTDSSKAIFGCVVYLVNLGTREVSFVMSKNKIVNKQLESKTIPSLELQALVLGTECVVDIYKEISEFVSLCPIKINKLKVFSDSLVVINWLNSYVLKLDKMQKRSVFVLNRLENISKLCETRSVEFSFVSGIENPADCVTRPMSHRHLMTTNYVLGPKFLTGNYDKDFSEDVLKVEVPNPKIVQSNVSGVEVGFPSVGGVQLVDPGDVSSFEKLVGINRIILEFVNCLKLKLKQKDNVKFAKLETKPKNHNFHNDAFFRIIRIDQQDHFASIFEYFENIKKVSKIPVLVNQLNVYIDKFGLLRVKSKCERIKKVKRYIGYDFPLLLSKSSKIIPLFIEETHRNLNHSGCYSILQEIRKTIWVPKLFSLVKRIVRNCVGCKRYNQKPIQLNQSSYREFRLDPSNIPFRNIFLDFMGPFSVKLNADVKKVYILIITCTWCRAINMKVCDNLTVDEFLRSFQIHIYEYGMPEFVVSDLGTQLVAGANTVKEFLDNAESLDFFQRHGLKNFEFNHYYKGHSELGSLIEICVKLTKRLIFGAIGRNILNYKDFEFIVVKSKHLVNRRPIGFKDALRDFDSNEIPEFLTPEKLIFGYDLVSLNVVPKFQEVDLDDIEWKPENENGFNKAFEQLIKVKNNLKEIYNEEFLQNLIAQATDKKGRYQLRLHKMVKPGDIVLVKEPFHKATDYPLARVQEVIKNAFDEVTSVKVVKGNKETLKRHVTTIIPLLSVDSNYEVLKKDITVNPDKLERPKRAAAIKCRGKIRDLM